MAWERGTRIALAGLYALMAATFAFAGVHATNVLADAKALARFDEAKAELMDARERLEVAGDALAAAVEEAVDRHASGAALLAVADPALLADAAVRDDLQAAIEAVVEDAGLTVAEDGAASPPRVRAPAGPVPPDAPADREARIAAALELRDEAESLLTAEAGLLTDAEQVSSATDALREAEFALVASARAKGVAQPVPEQASQETKDALAGALAALERPAATAELPALVAAYQEAWRAALASHEEAVRVQSAADIVPTYIRGILVVNKTYPLPSWYGDGLTAETSNAFAAMQAEAATLGLNLYISSGFRSYWSQQAIYSRYVSVDGQAAADRYSARPGHSEHQSGLTFDLNTITEAFGHTAEGIWVRDNAHRFGFVVRYPPGKEAITGYMWEPWHLRYLGVDVATQLYSSGLTLEEYLGITSRY